MVWDDADRCTDCGHVPEQCSCPHDCTPAGAATGASQRANVERVLVTIREGR